MAGPPPPPVGGFDFDIEGFDLFAGIDMGVQAAVLNASINFDATIFNDPIISTAIEPHPINPPVSTTLETKKDEVSSASAKMALLKARLNKPKSGTKPSTDPPPTAQNFAPQPPTIKTTVASVHLPVLPLFVPTVEPTSAYDSATHNALLMPHSPQISPLDLSKPDQPRTPGISSLIASSIISPDLLLGVPKTSEQRKSIPIYKSAQQSGQECLNNSAEDVFAFGDEDPEETGEKLKLDEDSDWEPNDHDTSNGDKENSLLEQSRRCGFGQKTAEPEKGLAKEVKKAAISMPEKDKARQETIEFSEQLMQRRNESLSTDYAVITQCEDTRCAIDSVKKNGEDADRPPLPRLIIRLPKKTNEDSFRRRTKRKRHYSDEETTEDEDDWYGEKPKKRRGRKPKMELHPEDTYSSRLVDPLILEQKRKEAQVDSQAMSMKDRIMKRWKQQENAGTDFPPPETARGVEGQVELKPLWRIVGEYRPAGVRERLEKMKECEGDVTRDSFLVLKSELHSADCALWRVDSMSLLQKYPSFLGKSENGELKLLYRKSTTYSGWCEQLQSNYMVVEVRPVRSRNVNNRGEGIVEPLVPLVELLPAISEEAKDRYCARTLTNKTENDQLAAQKFIRDNGIRNGLSKLIKSMLGGAQKFEYFPKPQSKKGNSSDELLDKIDIFLKELENIISDRVSFPREFQQNLKIYSSNRVIDSKNKENNCQICGESPVTNILQLYNLALDIEVYGEENNNDLEESLSAMDYQICTECCKLAQWQHLMLLDATFETTSRSPEQILDALRQNHAWIKEVVLAQTETWDMIMRMEESDCEKNIKEEADPHADPEAPATLVAIEASQTAAPAATVAPVPAVLPTASSGFSIASLLHS